MLIKRVYLNGAQQDVRCEDELITEIADELQAYPAEEVIEANLGELLPGLHDHHMHFFATAALHRSLDCGQIKSVDADHSARSRGRLLAQLLTKHPGEDWLRGVNYHESIAGDLDCKALDEMVTNRPIRIQHRSGKLWMLNSLAMQMLELDANTDLPGVELDEQGFPTGRLFRLDRWLRERLGAQDPIDVAGLSLQMASYGITGFTDASATNTQDTADQFEQLMARGEILQRTVLMGDDSLKYGHLKILLDEDNLPNLAALEERIRRARRKNRGVAFHCVSHVELLFALAALENCRSSVLGGSFSDRIEHGSLIFDDVLPLLKDLNLTIVTQPGFLLDRGVQYQKDLTPSEVDHLYRFKTLLDSGLPVGLSSDAPYGPLNPWVVMQCAVDRLTATGQVLGAAERCMPQQALASYISEKHSPGGSLRRVAVGETADLCLLDKKWLDVEDNLAEVSVAATIIRGQKVYSAVQQL
jgi:predicted amidohydrolase YtcJ